MKPQTRKWIFLTLFSSVLVGLVGLQCRPTSNPLPNGEPESVPQVIAPSEISDIASEKATMPLDEIVPPAPDGGMTPTIPATIQNLAAPYHDKFNVIVDFIHLPFPLPFNLWPWGVTCSGLTLSSLWMAYQTMCKKRKKWFSFILHWGAYLVRLLCVRCWGVLNGDRLHLVYPFQNNEELYLFLASTFCLLGYFTVVVPWQRYRAGDNHDYLLATDHGLLVLENRDSTWIPYGAIRSLNYQCTSDEMSDLLPLIDDINSAIEPGEQAGAPALNASESGGGAQAKEEEVLLISLKENPVLDCFAIYIPPNLALLDFCKNLRACIDNHDHAPPCNRWVLFQACESQITWHAWFLYGGFLAWSGIVFLYTSSLLCFYSKCIIEHIKSPMAKSMTTNKVKIASTSIILLGLSCGIYFFEKQFFALFNRVSELSNRCEADGSFHMTDQGLLFKCRDGVDKQIPYKDVACLKRYPVPPANQADSPLPDALDRLIDTIDQKIAPDEQALAPALQKVKNWENTSVPVDVDMVWVFLKQRSPHDFRGIVVLLNPADIEKIPIGV
ncbi:MAG: hypothetical protein ACPGC9_01305 [Cytophagales bacterium]